MIKNKVSKKQLKEQVGDLWENSVFDNRSLDALENFARQYHEEADTKQNTPNKDMYFSLATSRNRQLITEDQQEVLRKTTAAFFGMSVGSHAAITWALESRCDNIKIIDPDVLSSTNLNRLGFGFKNLGKLKIDLVKKQMMLNNPSLNVISSTTTNPDQVKKLFDQKPKVDVVVDAIDDLEGKVNLRKFCKERKLPLVMATDVGDNVVLDIERYDIGPVPKFFSGKVPGIEKIDFSKLSDLEYRKIICKIVGFEENSEAMLQSLLEIGKSISTWPQLAATAAISGGVVATTIKKIKLGEKIESGRYYFSLDSILVKDFNSLQRTKAKEDLIKQVKKKFKIDETD